MGILNRFIDMTKAAANELMDKLENPAMMLNHYVRNMQGEIDAMQTELQKQKAMAGGLRQQSEEAVRLAEQSDAKALEAMSAGYEAAAREALAAKLHYAEQSREYEALIANANSRIAELSLRLEEAHAELGAMQKKREELIARMQQTGPKACMAMSGCGFEDGSAARGFQRIEEKIIQWEAHAQLRSMPYGCGYAGASAAAANAAAQETAAHSAKEALIDEQLEQIRKRITATE